MMSEARRDEIAANIQQANYDVWGVVLPTRAVTEVLCRDAHELLADADAWRARYDFLAAALLSECDEATVERVMGCAQRARNAAMNLAEMSQAKGED